MARMRNIVTNITVEPSIFLFVLASELSGPTLLAFIYHRSCLDRFVNDTSICTNRNNETYMIEEDWIQTDTSHWLIYTEYVRNIPCIFVTFIYGIVSDMYSPKVAVAMPLIMAGMQTLVLMLMVVCPSSPSSLFFLAALLFGIGGGWTTFFSQTLGYVTRATSENDRTERLAIANGMYNIAAIIAYMSGGVLLDNTMFIFVFSTVFILYAIGVIYTCLRIKTVIMKPNKWSHGPICKMAVLEVKDSVKTLFRRRPHNRRCQIIAMLFIAFLILIGASRKFISMFISYFK